MIQLSRYKAYYLTAVWSNFRSSKSFTTPSPSKDLVRSTQAKYVAFATDNFDYESLVQWNKEHKKLALSECTPSQTATARRFPIRKPFHLLWYRWRKLSHSHFLTLWGVLYGRLHSLLLMWLWGNISYPSSVHPKSISSPKGIRLFTRYSLNITRQIYLQGQ